MDDKQANEKHKNDVQTNDVINEQNEHKSKIAAPRAEVKIEAVEVIQEEETKVINPPTTPDDQVDATPPPTPQSKAETAATQSNWKEEDPTVTAARKAQEEESAKAAAEKAREKGAADRKTQKVVNILLVGRSRSGKTTLMEMLKDPFHISPAPSLFYATVQPKEVEIKLNGYTFRVLDTPGLFELVELNSKTKERSNTEIAQVIEAKVCDVFGGQGYGNVDVAIFTNSVLSGINEQDIKSLQFFLPKIHSQTKKLFVITRAEEPPELTLEKIRNQCDASQLRDVINEAFGGKENILFSGALSERYLEFKEMAFHRFARILELREHLIDSLLADHVTPQERAEFHRQELEDFEVKLQQFLKDIPNQFEKKTTGSDL